MARQLLSYCARRLRRQGPSWTLGLRNLVGNLRGGLKIGLIIGRRLT
jgi:hypothetical protein